MGIEMKQSSMVQPAEKTPRRRLWLSCLDLVVRVPFTHTPIVQFFKNISSSSSSSTSSITNNNDDLDLGSSKKFFDTEILKESLSKALVPFYPLAGRLIQDENGRLEIDCNGEGALFIEAEANKYELADFEDNGFMPTDEMYELLIPRCDYSLGFSSFPLLMVQLTRFRCGGVALGFAQHHQLGDGPAYIHFQVSWSRLTRGLHLEYPPVLDRIPHLLPRCPPYVQFHHLEYQPPVPGDPQLETTATTVSVCRLSKDQINDLKLKVTSFEEVSSYKLSTFELLAGHVWRTACKARGLADNQEVKLLMPVDGRSRLGLPKGYFGNVIFQAACVAKVKDVTCKPLWYAASEVHKALRMKTNEEYLRSAIDYLESQPDVVALARGAHTYGCPNLVVNSWARLPLYETDYGWGRPIFEGNGGVRCEGQCFILQSPNRDGSLLVAAKLFTKHMPLFQEYLYDF